ncbi:MAG: hypothetical protein ACM3JF_01805 [Sphaerimonospora mesophila]
MKFPKVVATKPPQPLSKNAALLGKVAAGIVALFTVVQLIGIDKMIDGLNQQLPDGGGLVTTVAVVVLLSGIMSLPFLLRYKISELARFMSGILAVLVPWVWLLIAIWSVGTGAAAAQFGVITGINVEWWVVAFNAAWLILNFYTVRQLGLEKTWRTLRGSARQLKKTAK